MEIRNISTYMRSIKDKYYITCGGVVYTTVYSKKVMFNGEQRTITRHMLDTAKSNDEPFSVPFKDWGLKCIVLKDGTVLRVLKTQIRECGSVHLGIFDIHNVEKRFYVSRLVANTFICDVTGKEVHHKDNDRTNNCVSNLEVLTFEEHRGVGHHKKNHYQV